MLGYVCSSRWGKGIETHANDRSSRLHMFFKIDIFKNFTILTGKHLCWSLFLIMTSDDVIKLVTWWFIFH